MRIINSRDIMETIEMLTAENLDVRTVTMGISLLDCIDPDADKACEKIYNKITRLAGNLVSVVDGISAEYGIPIVNKRISVTPIAMLLGAAPDADPVQYAKTLDRAAKAVGVNFIGGFGALVHKGFSAGDKRLIAAIPRALAETDIVCSSVNIGSTKSGINMDAVKLMGEVVRETAELTKDNMCMGDAKLVVFCNAPEDNPFMAGAFHGAGEPDCEIHVGVSGPGAVRAALAKLPKDAPMDEVAELVKRTAFKITRLGQLVANLASERLGVPAGIIDLSLAPTPAIGDSVANILEEMGLESCGCCGTTACLALLNDAVKKGGVMASNHVGGLSGAFIPVSEDDGMINAANCGSLTLEKLEAMTAVCSVGIDMVVIPGDTSAEVISGLIADEAAIGMVNSKTTAVRVIPAIGHKAGDVLDFGGLLGHAPTMPISRFSCNGAAMQQGNLPYKRKPKAYAAHLPASGFIYPEKGLEHTCPILLRDAAACVCNTQHSAAFLLPDRDMHRTAGGIVFDAVFNQIKEQAVDQGVAALDADILTFLKEGDAPALCQWGQVSHDLIGQRGQLDMVLARNRLQIAHFQQCADKAC